MTFETFIREIPEPIKEILNLCKTTPQSPKWHPEGNVYNHIRIVFNRSLKIGKIDFMISAIFHDLGKAEKTILKEDGNYSAYDHEKVSEDLVLSFSDWIESVGGNVERIYEIVSNHMRIKYLSEFRRGKKIQIMESPYFRDLLTFAELDNMKTLTNEELLEI